MRKNIADMNILVTGGAGFIGSNIVEKLLQSGVKFVRIFDNLSTGSKTNIESLLSKYPNVEFVWGDVTNLQSCIKSCIGIDAVCHQAALGSVPRSIENPLDSHDVNVNGFINIVVACKQQNIKRIVYASSSSVYGDNNADVKIEHENGNLLSPYAVTKYVTELYGNIFTKIYGLECIALRYFNVFGPKQNPNGVYAAVIPKFINQISKNIKPIINGDGSYSRDFTYVDNVVDANILALTTTNNKCYGQAFNVGTNNSVSISSLVDKISRIINNNITPVYIDIRAGDIPHSNASIDKTKLFLEYEPKVYFDDGLAKTIDYFLPKK